ncbi:hypothetical protein KEM52_000368 [Ascosphaera acerosa]|nr:hypothetical protein KEM52_000368 [Ascosphaera acerosa]
MAQATEMVSITPSSSCKTQDGVRPANDTRPQLPGIRRLCECMMVSTRSKTRSRQGPANAIARSQAAQQPGITAFARATKANAGLGAGKALAKKSSIAKDTATKTSRRTTTGVLTEATDSGAQSQSQVQRSRDTATKRKREQSPSADKELETSIAVKRSRVTVQDGVVSPVTKPDVTAAAPSTPRPITPNQQCLQSVLQSQRPSPTQHKPAQDSRLDEVPLEVAATSTGSRLENGCQNRVSAEGSDPPPTKVADTAPPSDPTNDGKAEEEDELATAINSKTTLVHNADAITHARVTPAAEPKPDVAASDTVRADNMIRGGDSRPACYQDLVSLHAAFLTALSFYFAHNSISSPADLAELLPTTQKIWKKRAVTLIDLRRILLIANRACVTSRGDAAQGEDLASTIETKDASARNQESSAMMIVRYGPNKVCLEFTHGHENNRYIPPFKDEPRLHSEFCAQLESQWHDWRASASGESPAQRAAIDDDIGGDEGSDISAAEHPFQAFLPLEDVQTSSITTTTPRVGRQRLLEVTQGNLKLKSLQSADSTLKESAARARANRQTRRSALASPSSSANSGTATRKTSLLERIRARESQSASATPAPTAEQSARTAASQHLAKVRGILACMRPSSQGLTPQRRAYRWDEVVGNVLQSLKTPVSRQEVETCLTMLADDVKSKAWVKLVQVGEVRSVVLMSAGLQGWLGFAEGKAGAESMSLAKKKLAN